jgi:hypothetical protein
LSEALEETMEEKARGIVREFLKTRGMGLDEFRRLRKGHPDKIALAAELRQSTTMTMAWIAEELNAGVPQTFWKALWKTGKKRQYAGLTLFFDFSSVARLGRTQTFTGCSHGYFVRTSAGVPPIGACRSTSGVSPDLQKIAMKSGCGVVLV